ncbi:MAG: SGNH/GDSL hydrolase family protein, partial [Bacteroidota bacterium]
PPNLGKDYEVRFNSIFKDLAKEYKAGLIPFLLENVGGIPSLNLPDGKHPNEEGQKIVADNVWKVLEAYLM